MNKHLHILEQILLYSLKNDPIWKNSNMYDFEINVLKTKNEFYKVVMNAWIYSKLR